MENKIGVLADIAKKRSPYLAIGDNESVEAIYKGFKMVPSSFNPEDEIFRFLLEVEIGDEKFVKFWETGSNKIAIVFDTLKEGDKVLITRNVEISKTGKNRISWEAEPLKK